VLSGHCALGVEHPTRPCDGIPPLSLNAQAFRDNDQGESEGPGAILAEEAQQALQHFLEHGLGHLRIDRQAEHLLGRQL